MLENFDALGRWRENYPVKDTFGEYLVIKPDPAVDATGAMPDAMPLTDVVDLKNYVVMNIDLVCDESCREAFPLRNRS